MAIDEWCPAYVCPHGPMDDSIDLTSSLMEPTDLLCRGSPMLSNLATRKGDVENLATDRIYALVGPVDLVL